MEEPLINHQNLIEFPINIHSFPSANSINHQFDDIEMFAFQSKAYTSMKDLLQSSSPSSVASPTSISWREIPIKDPLVQHAAWAYLQPMAEARDSHDSWWRRLEKKCCWFFSCFNDVVLVVFNGWSSDDDCKVE